MTRPAAAIALLALALMLAGCAGQARTGRTVPTWADSITVVVSPFTDTIPGYPDTAYWGPRTRRPDPFARWRKP